MNQFSENILATYIQTYGRAGPISYTITLTMFPPLNAPGTCLTLKLEGMVLIEWQHLKEGRPLFEKKRNHLQKTSTFHACFFPNNNR